MEGKIIRGIAGFYYVQARDRTVWQCRARGVFRREGLKPLAGDNVTFEITHEGDREGNITDILPRANMLIRPPVANVDGVLLTFAVKAPDVSHYLINRFLVLLRQKGLPAILCFNKKDLAPEEETEAYLDIYRNAGCGLCAVSAKTREGLDALRGLLKGRVTAVAGPSGAGKSSLINALSGEQLTQTGQLSKKIERGKNTTRHSELFLLPDADTYVFDTPGFMSLTPEGLTAKELHRYYPEMEAAGAHCRFATCTHLTEPGCAVREALEEGKISRVRYDTYRLYYDELSGQRPVYVKKAKKAPREGR